MSPVCLLSMKCHHAIKGRWDDGADTESAASGGFRGGGGVVGGNASDEVNRRED